MGKGTGMHQVEHGCGTMLVILGGIIIVVCVVVCIVAAALLLARAFGLWPDWAIELELLVKAWMKVWMR